MRFLNLLLQAQKHAIHQHLAQGLLTFTSITAASSRW